LRLSFTEAPYINRFGLAARCGFRAVESLFPYTEATSDEVLAELEKHGLQQVLVNAPPGDWAAGDRGLGGICYREAEFGASMEQALSYASAIGCPRVHVLAGLKAHGATESTFISRLRAAAPVAHDAGIRLCVEALNGHDVPGYLIPTQEDAAKIVKAVGHPGCGLQFDLYAPAVPRALASLASHHLSTIAPPSRCSDTTCRGRLRPGLTAACNMRSGSTRRSLRTYRLQVCTRAGKEGQR
jgi:hydroxypyruvate isomerase